MKGNEYAGLLTASLTESEPTPFEELFDRIEQQAEANLETGKCWIAAVRKVERDGRLSADQAMAMVWFIATAMAKRCCEQDPAACALEERIRALHAAREAGRRAIGARRWRRLNKDLETIADEWATKQDAFRADLLTSIGEQEVAWLSREGERDFRMRAVNSLLEVIRASRTGERAWKVEFPSPDSPPPAPHRPLVEPWEDRYFVEVDWRAERWRQATRREWIWTVESALDFAFLESCENEDGEGDLWIASIQRARAEGVLEKNLSYALLDRITEAMAGDGPDGDPVLRAIEEKIEDAELEYNQDSMKAFASDPHAPEECKAIQRAWDRRMTLLKIEILRASGEDEMVRLMESEAAAFRARLERTRSEWGIAV
jgi:hypothetical protein